jgi:hypothetical protein
MSDVITYNTETNQYTKQEAHVDPWEHLDVDGWVQKQVEWGEANPSGRGLIPYLQKLGTDLVGAEIGVCLGVTAELILKDKDTNIKTYYAVDNYPTYIDWNDLPITTERQERIKANAHKRLSKFPLSFVVEFVYEDSETFAASIVDESLDFIFIDADHTYEGALRDFKQFWPKVKKGGIFAGHDLNIPTVNKAIREFFGEKITNVIPLVDNAWLYYKD